MSFLIQVIPVLLFILVLNGCYVFTFFDSVLQNRFESSKRVLQTDTEDFLKQREKSEKFDRELYLADYINTPVWKENENGEMVLVYKKRWGRKGKIIADDKSASTDNLEEEIKEIVKRKKKSKKSEDSNDIVENFSNEETKGRKERRKHNMTASEAIMEGLNTVAPFKFNGVRVLQEINNESENIETTETKRAKRKNKTLEIVEINTEDTGLTEDVKVSKKRKNLEKESIMANVETDMKAPQENKKEKRKRQVQVNQTILNETLETTTETVEAASQKKRAKRNLNTTELLNSTNSINESINVIESFETSSNEVTEKLLGGKRKRKGLVPQNITIPNDVEQQISVDPLISTQDEAQTKKRKRKTNSSVDTIQV